MEEEKRNPLNQIYKQRFFSGRDSLAWRAPIIAKNIKDIFSPKTAVDVGCAIGDVVQSLIDLGIDASGLEGSPEAEPFLVCDRKRVLFHDLRMQVPSGFHFDFALSLEVAEHIEAEYAPMYVYNLTELSDRILISAAPPGQKGHYHVNCRPAGYWEQLFWEAGYERDKQRESQWRAVMDPWKTKKEMTAYINNALYFYKLSEMW